MSLVAQPFAVQAGEQPGHSRPSRSASGVSAQALVAIVITSLAMNLCILLFLAAHNPAYLRDYRLNSNPDAVGYVRLGHNFWTRGVYSRQETAPFAPDILRTPVYPLLAGAMHTFTGVIWPLYVLQIVFGAITAALVAKFAATICDRRTATVAGLLYAADLMIAVLNVQAMTESLFLLLSTAALLVWMRMFGRTGRNGASFGNGAKAGLLLGLAILTRPAGLIVPVVMAAALLAVLWKRGRDRRLRAPIALVLVVCVMVAPWILRNKIRFDVARLSNVDSLVLLYFGATGGYQVHYGVDSAEAQRRIVAEFDVPRVELAHNPTLLEQPVSETDRKERQAALTIISRYPGAFAASSAIGLAKALVAHDASVLAASAGYTWPGGGLGRLASGNLRATLAAVAAAPAALTTVCLWQLALAGTTLLLSVAGIVRLLADSTRRSSAMALLVVSGYYALTIMISGIDATYRHRAPLVPLLCVCAAEGAMWAASGFIPRRGLEHVASFE